MKKWTLDSIRCLSLVSVSNVAETSQRMEGHTPTEQLSGTFVSENQGKVTCKIGLCDNFLGLRVFFSLHITLGLLEGQTDPYRESYMSDLVQQGV